MILPDALTRATHRLASALDALEEAVARRVEADAARADVDGAFSAMEDDRSRLALELDDALARSRAFDDAAAEVSARLANAGATVRAVLAEIATADAVREAPAEASVGSG